MKLSVLIPAHNEEGHIAQTVKSLADLLHQEQIDHEILAVNDHSTDQTEPILKTLQSAFPTFRYLNNSQPPGFGHAIREGLADFKGDAVAIVMADASDDPRDLIRFYRRMEQDGSDCIFGSRWIKGGKTNDYPGLKWFLNRAGNHFIRFILRIDYDDTTNAFKLYRRHVIDGCAPFLSAHFNLTVELPLKAIVRGYSYSVIPNSWTQRKSGASKWAIKEMGSRYMFIIFYCLIENRLSRLFPKKKPIP